MTQIELIYFWILRREENSIFFISITNKMYNSSDPYKMITYNSLRNQTNIVQLDIVKYSLTLRRSQTPESGRSSSASLAAALILINLSKLNLKLLYSEIVLQ